MNKLVHIMYGILYIVGFGAFGYIFWTKHIPTVGMDYIYENWGMYVVMWVGGTAFWGLFYSFSMLMIYIDKTGRIE